MIGNEEILRTVGYGSQPLAVIENVNRHERTQFQFGIVLPQLFDAHAVDVADADARRHGERVVQRADFQAVALQITTGNVGAHVFDRMWGGPVW